MYEYLYNKTFIAKVSSQVKHVKILAAIPSEYFSDEGFNHYVESGAGQSPGATLNNKNNYISFWVKDVETNETFRVSEYEILMETTDMKSDEIKKNIDEYSDKIVDSERREKYGELGFDKHFYKCRDIGMSVEEALKSVIDLVKIKIDEDEK